ncbi:uncharacterized protein [Typha angustifolia]|uniref:uncharacterized protein isoform X2 n=1 Tax=Typha angustifolia TaxID=59011 RepID=UPI003C2ED974
MFNAFPNKSFSRCSFFTPMDPHQLAPALEQLHLDDEALLPSPLQPNPNPPHPHPHLRPSNSTAFKREERRKRRQLKRLHKLQSYSNPPPDHPQPSDRRDPPLTDLPWPCEPLIPSTLVPTEWPPAVSPAAGGKPPPHPPSVAVKAQANGVKASRAFFSTGDAEDDPFEEEEDEEEGQARACRFFSDLFETDGGLRGYYEGNQEKGEFSCLVCEGIGVRSWRKFPSCAGLVQHARTISKTRQPWAHRGFAEAVCRVLGWETDRLPSVGSDGYDEGELDI